MYKALTVFADLLAFKTCDLLMHMINIITYYFFGVEHNRAYVPDE